MRNRAGAWNFLMLVQANAEDRNGMKNRHVGRWGTERSRAFVTFSKKGPDIPVILNYSRHTEDNLILQKEVELP